MRCDTCGKETDQVRRVVVDRDYDRTLARALYNCADCYDRKERQRAGGRAQSDKP